VEERYYAYTAQTQPGRQFTGIISSESPNSVTLRAITGTEEAFLRSELAELRSMSQSLMPEGFELSLDPQAMADLISYVTASEPESKKFPGNRPQTVNCDASGAFRLMATQAEISGDSLVFENGYRNLGHWRSVNDRAVWTVQVSQEGNFDLWLDWARPGTEQSAALRLEVADRVAQEIAVPPTGSWDTYEQKRLGRVHLDSGRQRVSLRGVPPLEGAILDLRELRLTPEGQAAPSDFSRVVPN
jgi:hypothetical protein